MATAVARVRAAERFVYQIFGRICISFSLVVRTHNNNHRFNVVAEERHDTVVVAVSAIFAANTEWPLGSDKKKQNDSWFVIQSNESSPCSDGIRFTVR